MTSPLRGGARWLSRLLIAAGVLGLGHVVWSVLEMKVVQSRERRAFEERAGAAAAGRLPDALPGDPVPDSAPPSPARPVVGETIGLVRISRIGLDVVVKEGVDDATLKVAAGHIPETALPGAGGAGGNIALAAHRDTLFRPLRHVRIGDRVQLETDAGVFDYDVDATAIVEPSDVHVLAPRGVPTLTLVTCWPFDFRGSAPQRFVVHARQVAAGPRPGAYTPQVPETKEAP
jgi:sortase A